MAVTVLFLKTNDMKGFDFGFVETVSAQEDVIFECGGAQCVEIDEGTYSAVASALVRAVGESGFFSGSIDVYTEVLLYADGVGYSLPR